MTAVTAAVFDDSVSWRQPLQTTISSAVFDESLSMQPSLQQSLMIVFFSQEPFARTRYMHTVYIYWKILKYSYLQIHEYSNIHFIFTFEMLTFFAQVHAFAFPCSHTYIFFVFTYRHRCVGQGPCGQTYMENLRLLTVTDGSVCWWYQISSNIVGNQQKWRVTFHLAQGINLVIQEHRFLQFYSMMLQKILTQWRVQDMWKTLTLPCHRITLPCNRAFAQEIGCGF